MNDEKNMIIVDQFRLLLLVLLAQLKSQSC